MRKKEDILNEIICLEIRAINEETIAEVNQRVIDGTLAYLQEAKGWVALANRGVNLILKVLKLVGISTDVLVRVLGQFYPFSRYFQGIRVLVRLHLANVFGKI